MENYTPDFWLVDFDLYIELKGFSNDSGKSKLLNKNLAKARLLKPQYHKRVQVIFQEEFVDLLKEEGLWYGKKQSLFEIRDYRGTAKLIRTDR